MSTKIYSHRIADKQIKLNHIADDVKFTEGQQVDLNFPTHDNSNDLTTLQKQILTQGGNADAYHYHSGGGGGPEGVYTHEQIDAALLKIFMELNAAKYGLEHSIVERFDDATGIDYGISRPTISNVAEVQSSSDPNSLLASTSYYYRMAIKYQGNWTDASPAFKLTTTNTSTYRKGLISATISAANQGVKIWRAATAYVNQDVIIVDKTTMYSPESINCEVLTGAEAQTGTSKNALRIDYNGVAADSQKDIFSSTYGGTIIGEALSTIIQPTEQKPIVRFGWKNPYQLYTASQLYLVWNSNPAYVPLDYKMEYSTALSPDINNDAHWQVIPQLSLVTDDGAVILPTNGTLNSSLGTVTNNTAISNKFNFKTTLMTGIRISITRCVSAVRLDQFYCYYMGCSNGFKLYHSLNQSRVDLTGMKSMIFDMKSDVNQDKFLLGLQDRTYAGAVTNITNVQTQSNANTSISNTTGRLWRTSYYCGGVNYNGYNKVKIRFYPAGTVKISNVTIMLCETYTTPASTMGQTLRQVTFNNGLTTYQGSGNNGGYIDSDWISLDIPNQTFYSIIVTLYLESGTLYVGGSWSYQYTWYVDGKTLDYCWDTTGASWNNQWSSYTFCHLFQVAKGGAFKATKALPKGWDQWFTQCLDISADANSITDLAKLAIKMNGVDKNGSVYISNLRFSTAMELLKTGKLSAATVTTTGAGSAANTTDASLTTYWQSSNIPTILANESIMYKLNAQYLVEKIRLLENDASSDYTIEKYQIQYTIDNTAVVTDAFDSIKWNNVQNLRILNDINLGFTGTIVGGVVNNNNLHGVYVDHVFTPVQALAIRILVWKTKMNTAARIYDVEVFTVEDNTQYMKILDTETAQPTNFTFTDNGIVGTVDNPLVLNTTGTYNVYYDAANDNIRVFDPSYPGVFVSKTITTELFLKFLITCQLINSSGMMMFYTSNDGGATWVDTSLETLQSCVNAGTQFKFKVILRGSDILSAYSVLYTL